MKNNKFFLPGAALLVGLLVLGASCTTGTRNPNDGSPTTTPPSVTTTSTYGTLVEMWFEGWDRMYYEFTYPTNFTVQGRNPVVLEDRNSGTKMTIKASSEAGRGYTPETYWQEEKPCPDCAKKENTVNIKGASDMLTYGNADKHYVLFNGPMLFVVETIRPSDTTDRILESLTFIDNPEKSARMMKVKAALVVNEGDIPAGKKFGKTIGCNDQIVLETRYVRKSPQTLNAAFTELFSLKEPHYGEFGIENGVTTHNILAKTGLKFDRATLEDGTAKIYLTGEVSGLGGVCDQPRVPAQIEETTKQFSTVKKMEMYLNGELVDWEEMFQRMNRG
ncbi:MAG TPA: hypothetical protein VJA27_00620 [Patescibacteria group bacterium]|nr:hypothetical protein [Patescibacteria group bacterium]